MCFTSRSHESEYITPARRQPVKSPRPSATAVVKGPEGRRSYFVEERSPKRVNLDRSPRKVSAAPNQQAPSKKNSTLAIPTRSPIKSSGQSSAGERSYSHNNSPASKNETQEAGSKYASRTTTTRSGDMSQYIEVEYDTSSSVSIPNESGRQRRMEEASGYKKAAKSAPSLPRRNENQTSNEKNTTTHHGKGGHKSRESANARSRWQKRTEYKYY